APRRASTPAPHRAGLRSFRSRSARAVTTACRPLPALGSNRSAAAGRRSIAEGAVGRARAVGRRADAASADHRDRPARVAPAGTVALAGLDPADLADP